MEKKRRKRKKFLQFNEWISNMYPEYVRQAQERAGGKSLTDLEKENHRAIPLSKEFTFQVTDKCNLACTYCYQINKSTRRMPFETAKIAVDKLLSGADGFGDYVNPETSPAIVLDFIGGEPFLEVELIDQIVDYFREQAIKLRHPWAEKFAISICTNGVLYKDPKVQKFLQKNTANLSLSVTVDGIKELHDACRIFPDGRPSYDLAHGAALDWMARGYDMGSKITIAPNNIKFLSKSLKQMVEDGYYDINANCVYEDVWKPEHATELYYQCKDFTDFIKDKIDLFDYSFSLLQERCGNPLLESDNNNWCGGTGDMLAVDPDGRIFPCIRYMESSLGTQQKPIVIGDVWRGIAQKPCEKECLECMGKITRRSQSTDECFYCPIGQGCGWCSGFNYQTFGTVNKRATFTCEMHKAQALASCYFNNSFALLSERYKDFAMDLWVPEQWAVPMIGQEEYDKLVEMCRKLGRYVNDQNATMVKIHADEGSGEISDYIHNQDKIEVLAR